MDNDKLKQIETKLSALTSENLKLEFLENLLKQNIDNELRAYVHIKLAELYKARNWLMLASNHLGSAAELAKKEKEKTELYARQGELLIASGQYNLALHAFNKAKAEQPSEIKRNLDMRLVNALIRKANECFANKKYNETVKALSVIVDLNILQSEKTLQIIDKIIEIYMRLGRTHDIAHWKSLRRSYEELQKKQEKQTQKPKDVLDELGIRKL